MRLLLVAFSLLPGLVLFDRSAVADPIVYDIFGGDGGQNYGIIPSLDQGGTITAPIPGIYPATSLNPTSDSFQTFSTDLSLEIRYYPDGAPAGFNNDSGPGLPGLQVVAHITGVLNTYTATDPVAYDDRAGGSFTASVTSVTLDPYTPGLTLSSLPQSLVDLLQSPGRIQISGPDWLGPPGTYGNTTITIAGTVPEPTAFATLALGFAGFILARRIRLRDRNLLAPEMVRRDA